MSLTINHAVSAEIIDGRRIADEIKDEVRRALESWSAGAPPCLAVVRVGDDLASAVYVRNKVKTAAELGFRSQQYALPASTSADELLELLATLNRLDDVDGILVQLPLPNHITEEIILAAVDPAKDVDGFHPLNVGRLARSQSRLAPCTPAGIIELLQRTNTQIAGREACVVGRSHIVGRPIAEMLLQRNATVTICHSRTADLASVTSRADILVVAVGHINLIRAEHVKQGATVIDVGMNSLTDEQVADKLFTFEEAHQRRSLIQRRGSTLVGDVNRRQVECVAGRLTPVPGGVGPLTIAMLMKNTLTAATERRGESSKVVG